jgi:hypothetical protein
MVFYKFFDQSGRKVSCLICTLRCPKSLLSIFADPDPFEPDRILLFNLIPIRILLFNLIRIRLFDTDPDPYRFKEVMYL